MLRILGRTTSSNVQKVMWCCAELGLGVKREDVGGPFGGNDSDEYKAMNPNGLVPTMVEDDFVLWESNAIMRYLASKHGEHPFWPGDYRGRANADRWMDWQLGALWPALRDAFIMLVRTPEADRRPDVIARSVANAAEMFGILDQWLAARTFVNGPDLSIGDIPVGVIAHRWYSLDIERPELTNLKAWYGLLKARPAYRDHVMGDLA